MAIKMPSWPFKWTQASRQRDVQTRDIDRKALTSETYQAHTSIIPIEEAARRSAKARGPQNLSKAWDDDYVGMPGGFRTRDGGTLSERDQKDTYYQAYINNPWVRACVQAIAKRFTSGKWGLEEVEQGKGSQENYDRLMQLFNYVNDDQDFKQLLRSIAEDLSIFGESFVEIVYGSDGLPAQLHKIDCVTMSTQFDKHGMVTRYVQNLDKTTETQFFEPDQIIRWWLPDPRAGKKALSPIECMKDSVFLYNSMITFGEKFFKQGGKPVFSIEMGEDSNVDDAQRYIKFFRENYMGIQNAHVPPVFYGGSRLVEFGKGSVELDFLQSLAWCRDEVLAGYNVPLNVLGIQESAHLGGGTGESSNKIFVYNTVKPIEEAILETLNYRIAKRAFNIYDWIVTVSHADYRDDEQIAKISDMKIRNGSRLIDEIRREEGRAAYPKGGSTAFVVAGKDIMPVERLDELADEQRQQAHLSLQGAQLPTQHNSQDEGTEAFRHSKKKAQERWHGMAQQKAQKHQTREASLAQAYQTSFSETQGQPYQTSRSGTPSQRRRQTPGKSASGRQTASRQTPSSQGAASRQAGSASKSVTQTKGAAQGTSAHQEASSETYAQTRDQTSRQTPHEAPPPRETAREALSPETQEAHDPQTPYCASYSSQDTEAPREAQKDSVTHWQDADQDIQRSLTGLRLIDVKRLTWKAHRGACEGCTQNEGKTVNLGERFPSGAYGTPEHDHCICLLQDADTAQEYAWNIEDGYVLVKKEEGL